MATLAKRLMTVEEFLDIEFDTEERYELDNGVVRMMAGGLAIHARIQTNVIVALTTRLRGSGCSAYGPDMGVRAHGMSLRYPDASVFCGRDGVENDRMTAFDDPVIIVEVLSKGTRDRDIEVKLPEYRSIMSLQAILYIDPEDATVHLETRDAARGWVVTTIGVDEMVELPMPAVHLSWEEIFARG